MHVAEANPELALAFLSPRNRIIKIETPLNFLFDRRPRELTDSCGILGAVNTITDYVIMATNHVLV